MIFRYVISSTFLELDAIFTKLDRAAALVEQWEMAASEPVSERELMVGQPFSLKETYRFLPLAR